MTEKVIGYLLILAGLLVIAYAAISVVGVFTGRNKPVQPFNFPAISIDTSQLGQVKLPKELEDAGVKVEQKENTKQEILSADILNTSSNLIAHLILMGFIASIGFKIATIGTQLARVIKVNVKAINSEPKKSSSTLASQPQKG